MPIEGNGFFQVVLKQLLQIRAPSLISNANIFHEKVVSYFVDNINLYEGFLYTHSQEIKQSIKQKKCIGQWADYLMLTATSNMLKHPILIIRSNGEDPVLINGLQINMHLSEKDKPKVLYIGYNFEEENYVSLIKNTEQLSVTEPITALKRSNAKRLI